MPQAPLELLHPLSSTGTRAVQVGRSLELIAYMLRNHQLMSHLFSQPSRTVGAMLKAVVLSGHTRRRPVLSPLSS
jgi:hypothetical protein